jgi:glucosamine--fructose-6-phosphate aminotransferase (isomerizing)
VCGIVGYAGHRDAVSFLLPGLRRLEYRGYDSAGVAVVARDRLEVRKIVGKIAALEAEVGATPLRGVAGIGHTRWATHGRPTVANAHPHLDCDGRLAVVHNGIIENYRELRRILAAGGHRFRSQTDTEVVVHLIEHYRADGLTEAVGRAARDLRGSYAVACVAADAPDTVIAVRGGGCPLVIGVGETEVFLASDIPALLGETRETLLVEPGELAVLGPGRVTLRTLDGAPVHRACVTNHWDPAAAEKSGYPHFMLKEIFEQPEAIRATLGGRADADAGAVDIPELGLRDRDLAALNRLTFVACGTSWHAALIGKHLVEGFARLPVEVELASEFRHRQLIVDARVLTVAISQSGETADTLAALHEARQHGARVLAICNVVGSSLAREADGVLYTRAGLEIGVASTKAFTAQVVAVTLLALKLGLARGFVDASLVRYVTKALWEVPDLMADVLARADEVAAVARRLATAAHALYLGRGLQYPLALEGALKLKEVSYIHAEGAAAGEMKHGPIALIEPGMPIVALAPRGLTYEKMAGNIEEVRARDGFVIAVGTAGDRELAARADAVLTVPAALDVVQPLLLAVPLQLLAYHGGVLRGCDVDQPRNLAKSVTVE